MAGKLYEKVAIVVGASGAIGKATAHALVREGAQVVLASRNGPALEALGAEIARDRGRVVVQPTDVRQEVDVVRLVSRALDAFGALDIVVLTAHATKLHEVAAASSEEWREMAEVNALASAILAREAVAVMAEGRGGDLVTVSPTLAKSAGGAFANATRAFSNAFAEGLREEMRRRGVRVMTVSPGAGVEAGDVADAVLFALTRSRRLTLEELVLSPTL